jgi:hypothetical protein
MKSTFEIFVLTKREQRAVILIMMAMLAATIANHYRDRQSQVISARSTSAEPSITPSSNPAEEETAESESP